MKTRLLIIIGILSVGFTGIAFGQYIGDKLPPNTIFDPVTGKANFPKSLMVSITESFIYLQTTSPNIGQFGPIFFIQ